MISHDDEEETGRKRGKPGNPYFLTNGSMTAFLQLR